MGLKTYKATLMAMTAAQKLLGFKLRVSGTESLPDRPTMYVSNHFTRIETFLKTARTDSKFYPAAEKRKGKRKKKG